MRVQRGVRPRTTSRTTPCAARMSPSITSHSVMADGTSGFAANMCNGGPRAGRSSVAHLRPPALESDAMALA